MVPKVCSWLEKPGKEWHRLSYVRSTTSRTVSVSRKALGPMVALAALLASKKPAMQILSWQIKESPTQFGWYYGITFCVLSCWRDAVSPMYVWRKLLLLIFFVALSLVAILTDSSMGKYKNQSLRNHHLAFPTVRFPRRKKPPGWRNICMLKKSTAGCLRKVDVLLMAWDLQPKDVKLGKWEYQVQEIYVFWRVVVIFGKF